MLTRRRFLSLVGGGTVCAAGAYAYGRLIEPNWLDVVRLDIPLRHLPDGFAGLTIAQISDLHFGPLVAVDLIEPAIQAILDLRPDVVAITGDFVSSLDHDEPARIEQALARLRAPLGVYAVLGNHDWWENAHTVTTALRRAGVMVLSNEHVTLPRDGGTLHLVGIDDVWCGKHDFARAMRGIPPNAATIALVHEPDYADVVANDARVLLQLSGHSHGGQVRVPYCGGLYFPPFGRKYPMGQYRVRELTLYTNRGLGMVNRPIRFACRPEVTLLTLCPEVASA